MKNGENSIFVETTKKMKQFILLEEELNRIRTEYKDKYKSLYNQIKTQVTRIEYSTGGNILHRGYYCPSPTIDIVTGKCKRGKIFNEKPKNNDFSYKYSFDKADNLIMIESSNCEDVEKGNFTVEFLLYNNNDTMAISFDNYNEEIESISKCKYEDNKIISYLYALCPLENVCYEMRLENYSYKDNLISTVNIAAFNPLNSLLQEECYVFNRDKAGYITSFKGGEIKNGVVYNNTYYVRQRKK